MYANCVAENQIKSPFSVITGDAMKEPGESSFVCLFVYSNIQKMHERSSAQRLLYWLRLLLFYGCVFFKTSFHHNSSSRYFQNITFITDINGVLFVCGHWIFQVTGRESLTAERLSRPVKIAESDADVSESFCPPPPPPPDSLEARFLTPSYFKISVSEFLQSTTEAQLTLAWLYCVFKCGLRACVCVCVFLSCGKQAAEGRERMYIATLRGHPSTLLSEGLRVSTTAFIFLPAI